MSNSALKLLAQKAKKRLSSAGQSLSVDNQKQNNKSTFAYLTNGTYAIVASRQKIEDDPLFDKVKKPESKLCKYSLIKQSFVKIAYFIYKLIQAERAIFS